MSRADDRSLRTNDARPAGKQRSRLFVFESKAALRTAHLFAVTDRRAQELLEILFCMALLIALYN